MFCSDGDPAFRPTPEELKPVINADRTVDYLHECTGADPTLRLWKVRGFTNEVDPSLVTVMQLKIGTFLARWVLRLPGESCSAGRNHLYLMEYVCRQSKILPLLAAQGVQPLRS